MAFIDAAWDIQCTSPDGVGLQRILRPRDASMIGSFGPMAFSNFDQILTLTRSGTALPVRKRHREHFEL